MTSKEENKPKLDFKSLAKMTSEEESKPKLEFKSLAKMTTKEETKPKLDFKSQISSKSSHKETSCGPLSPTL